MILFCQEYFQASSWYRTSMDPVTWDSPSYLWPARWIQEETVVVLTRLRKARAGLPAPAAVGVVRMVGVPPTPRVDIHSVTAMLLCTQVSGSSGRRRRIRSSEEEKIGKILWNDQEVKQLNNHLHLFAFFRKSSDIHHCQQLQHYCCLMTRPQSHSTIT